MNVIRIVNGNVHHTVLAGAIIKCEKCATISGHKVMPVGHWNKESIMQSYHLSSYHAAISQSACCTRRGDNVWRTHRQTKDTTCNGAWPAFPSGSANGLKWWWRIDGYDEEAKQNTQSDLKATRLSVVVMVWGRRAKTFDSCSIRSQVVLSTTGPHSCTPQ